MIGRDQAWSIIERIPQIDELLVDNDRDREKTYKEVLLSCDPERLVGVIKTIYRRREERSAQGKKNTAVDERYFKQAENHLYTELAFALGEDKDSMPGIIQRHIEAV